MPYARLDMLQYILPSTSNQLQKFSFLQTSLIGICNDRGHAEQKVKKKNTSKNMYANDPTPGPKKAFVRFAVNTAASKETEIK